MKRFASIFLCAGLLASLSVAYAFAQDVRPPHRGFNTLANNGANDEAVGGLNQALATTTGSVEPDDSAPPIDDSTDARVHAATEALVAKLRSLQSILKDRPARFERDAWSDPIAASEDLLSKVREAIKLRIAILRLTGDVNQAGAVSRTELSNLRAIFASLKTQAEDEVTGADGSAPLPRALLDAVTREIAALEQGITACDGIIRWAAGVMAQHKESVSVIQRAGPMLGRMELAAQSFFTLARIGQEIDSLDATIKEFAIQLNLCLDLMDALAYSTQRAVDEIAPPTPPKNVVG